MAKDNTILILGGIGVAALLFRQQLSGIFQGVSNIGEGIGQAFQGFGASIDTSLGGIAGLIAGVSQGGQSLVRETVRDTNQVLRDVTNTVDAATNQGIRIIDTTGNVVNTGLNVFNRGVSAIPSVVTFPIRFGQGIGDFTQDILLGGNRTVGGGAISNAINRATSPINEWIASASQNVRHWVSSVVSSPGPNVNEDPTPSSSTNTAVQTTLRRSSGSSTSARTSSPTPIPSALRNTTASERLLGRSIPNPISRFHR